MLGFGMVVWYGGLLCLLWWCSMVVTCGGLLLCGMVLFCGVL